MLNYSLIHHQLATNFSFLNEIKLFQYDDSYVPWQTITMEKFYVYILRYERYLGISLAL